MNNIKKLRIKAKIKQVDLCSRIGVTQGALSGWENEKYEPDIKSLNKMAQIFGVSVDYLLGNDDRQKGVRIPVIGISAAGVPLKTIIDIMGHADSKMVMNIYGHYNNDQGSAAREIMGKYLKDKC